LQNDELFIINKDSLIHNSYYCSLVCFFK